MSTTFRVIDTETTSFEGGVVEIASVDIVDGVICNPMSDLVRPPEPISFEAMAIHHITEKMVADAPLIDDVIGRYLGADKLSELSKPVAWIIGEESIEEFTRGYETFVVRGDDVDSTEETMKLYSQEYVSALLQRITELERTNQSQDDHINQQQDRIDSLEKTNAGLGQRLGAAEKRLATPVRLPKRWDVSGQVNPPRIVEVQFEQQNRTHDQCAEAIRAAGFTVEGDEQ
ncbi:exonuclease domain-containing protein [Serratia marcescens]|uniref:exonuclease domain-containing protein n=1 Tax=Serratia marcescens TaxID=615 RepID=UPI0027E56975|nr:exonuclease domain-containing protein [Serratia marcescens]